MERRVKRPHDDGRSLHLAEDPGKVLALVIFQGCERVGGRGGASLLGGGGLVAIFAAVSSLFALAVSSRELGRANQRAHRADAVGGGEEHVLGADEADPVFFLSFFLFFELFLLGRFFPSSLLERKTPLPLSYPSAPFLLATAASPGVSALARTRRERRSSAHRISVASLLPLVPSSPSSFLPSPSPEATDVAASGSAPRMTLPAVPSSVSSSPSLKAQPPKIAVLVLSSTES